MDENIELIHTMAYQQFIPLFVRAGLEIDENEECPEGLITCLKLKDCRTEKTAGAAVLVYTENVYVMKAVAVEKEDRGNGLGVLLVREILNEAERRGADKVFLNAKIPDFYQKLGFEILQREKAPAISDCSTCSRYLHGCKPEIMVKKIS